jgi:hypothetical protein
MNNIAEEDILIVLEGCLDHPNLEVLQIVEKLHFSDEPA